MGGLSFAEQPSAPLDLLDSYPSSLLEARPSQPFAQGSCSSLAATSDAVHPPLSRLVIMIINNNNNNKQQ